MASSIERRLAVLERQARPNLVGIWDTEEDPDGVALDVWDAGQRLESMTVNAWREQYPDCLLLIWGYGTAEEAGNAAR